MVLWSGACPGGVADGPGSSVRTRKGQVAMEAIGTLKHGKRNGPWVEHHGFGDNGKECRESGSYVDGVRQGPWEWHHCGYFDTSGSYVDGKRNGQWVYRYPSGNCIQRMWHHGKLQKATKC